MIDSRCQVPNTTYKLSSEYYIIYYYIIHMIMLQLHFFPTKPRTFQQQQQKKNGGGGYGKKTFHPTHYLKYVFIVVYLQKNYSGRSGIVVGLA